MNKMLIKKKKKKAAEEKKNNKQNAKCGDQMKRFYPSRMLLCESKK
jgi:hypothetical protein